MKKIVLYLFISIVSIFSVFSANDSYFIKIKLNGLKYNKIIIGHYYLDKVLVNDTLSLDNAGTAIYKGDTKLQEGLYVISVMGGSYFDFMIGKQQKFEIETDTSNFLNAKFKNSDDNKAFFEYQKLIEKNKKLVKSLQAERSQTTDTKKISDIDNQLNQINVETVQYRNKLINDNKGTFLSVFLKSTIDTEIPENLRKASNEVQYYYYREHFFDNVDLTDSRLLYTPILMQRFNRFFERIVPQIPDTLNKEIDRVVEKASSNRDFFQAVVSQLHLHYNQSKIMGFDKVFVHISEKYYLTGQAFWVSNDYVEKLKDKIRRMKPCLIGEKAKELKMRILPTDSAKMKTLKVTLELIRKEGIELAKDTSLNKEKKLSKYIDLFNGYTEQMEEYASLYQVEANYTVLWFWEPTCNHCVKATPKLKDLYDKYKSKGVDIFSVCITNAAFMEGDDFFKATEKNWNRYIDEVALWYSFVQNNHLNCFTNVFDPYHYTQFREYYDISATPSVFILDKDKKIVAKQVSIEQVDEILNDLIKK